MNDVHQASRIREKISQKNLLHAMMAPTNVVQPQRILEEHDSSSLEKERAFEPPSMTTVPIMGTPGTVLVLGGRGRLGYACVQAFAQAGWKVLAHVRPNGGLVQQGLDSPIMPGAVRWTDALMDDVAAWSVLQRHIGKVDVVVNALAPKFSTKAWQSELGQLNQSGLQIAKQCDALLIVPLSILSFAHHLPTVLHEDVNLPLPHHIGTRIGALRSQTEMDLRMAAESGQSVCTLRAGAFYGHPGDGWLSGAIAKSLPDGRMTWLGPYDVQTPWVYVHDLAQTIERIACQRQKLDTWTRLHFAGHQVSGAEWRDALAKVAVRRGWLQSEKHMRAGKLRWGLWRPLGWFTPKIQALCEMEYVWRTPHRLDNQRLQALIGAEPRTDWQRSVEQTMDLIFPASTEHL